MCGYANALSFKNIVDTDIASVEKTIREESMLLLSANLSDTCNAEDVVIDDDQLRDYFGNNYAAKPNEFKFKSGDIILIKELVNHVKHVVDDNGKNSGLHKFKSNKKSIMKKKIESISEKMPKVGVKECQNSSLKLELLQKYVECLESINVEKENINLNALDESKVKVFTHNNNPIYGCVTCLLCEQQNKEKCMKRIYYHIGHEGSFWVLSNIVKHMKIVHGLSIHHSNKKRKSYHKTPKNSQTECDTYIGCNIQNIGDDDADKQTMEIQSFDADSEYENTDRSVICKTAANNFEKNDGENVSLTYSQISHQISEITASVMMNSETQEPMDFLSDIYHKRQLTVAKIAKDGNCCFGALAHQLFHTPIGSEDHKKNTKELRKNVVKYILDPNNYPSFKQALKSHIYDIKDEKDITDIDFDCMFLVRHCLPRSGTWAGPETLKAVSEIYKVNIFVFYENTTGIVVYDKSQQYERSVMIAYRLGEINSISSHNHYDSVCDIDSEALYEFINFISIQMHN